MSSDGGNGSITTPSKPDSHHQAVMSSGGGIGAFATPSKLAEKPRFSAREDEVLKVAWLCLKSGPPEIDIKKLTTLGGFKTEKTAGNTWGTIKKKLLVDADGNPVVANPNMKGTSTTASKGTPKSDKRSKTADEDSADGGATPAKKLRKTPAKKGVKEQVKEEVDEDEM